MESVERSAGEEAQVTWSVRLYRLEPGKRAAVVMAALAAGCFGWLLFQNLIFVILGFIAVMASTSEFWVPLHYRLDEKGASVRCGFSVTAIEWSNVRRVAMGADGWKLSPHAEQRRLSPFRGVFLRFGEDADGAKAYVRRKTESDARFVEFGTDAGGGAGAS